MPSLLSRFWGKKKNPIPSPLLDGEKYEAVPKATSSPEPSIDPARPRQSKEKGHDRSQSKRSKRSPAVLYDSHLAESAPILSLRLPEPKDGEKKSQGLGVVFEGITDGPQTLNDEALGDKRLSPSETLVLVQKTSEVLNERGLETLGVMRPHWFASPRQRDIQLKLIHRFLATLESQKLNTMPPSPTPQSAFEAELRYSRDPHDVAAVLRWGLRHLKLEDKERSSSYPAKAFDDILVPLLPEPHANLLRATLDMVSSLAAHSEENGVSGNKLSKVLGWWVVSTRNIKNARWPEFYAHWEDAARQFEHLFLAYIRAQDAQSRMPKRLIELVKNYPFAKNRRDEDGIYLPRSRFSTRSADALFVQITNTESSGSSRPHPLRIIEDAFRAVPESNTTGVYETFWEELRKVASQSAQASDKSRGDSDGAEPPLNLSSILADESIRLFSLVPTPDGAAAPTLSLFTPLPVGRGRRSLSFGETSPTSHAENGRPLSVPRESKFHNKPTVSPPLSSPGHDVFADWQTFSSSGFDSRSGLSLAASLWDNDTEISQPAVKKAGGAGKRSSKTGSSRPRSADRPPSTSPAINSSPKPTRRTYGAPRLVKLDEAFIDFWADSLLDSIARTWPTFVICQLKPLPALKRLEDDKPLEWLIIERVVEEPARPTPPLAKSSSSARAASPLPSPTRSEESRASRWALSTLSAARKRLSAFSSKHDSAPAAHGGRDRAVKKAAKDVKVGEMGEILKEEDEGDANGVKENGTDKAETPKKASEEPQQAPADQSNGVSKSEEIGDATPKAKDSTDQEESAALSEPVGGTDILTQLMDISSAVTTESVAPVEPAATAKATASLKSDEVAEPEPEIAIASASAEAASAREPAEPHVEAAAPVNPVPETILEEPSAGVDQSEEVVSGAVPSQPEQSAVGSTSGLHVHHATIHIPPADESDLAQAKAELAEPDNVEPSTSIIPQPNESKPVPDDDAQEPNDVGGDPGVLTTDAANADTGHQEAPTEETRPEEHPNEASS